MRSYLLGLPQELQDKIYYYAIGNQTIHIRAIETRSTPWDTPLPPTDLCHQLCNCHHPSLLSGEPQKAEGVIGIRGHAIVVTPHPTCSYACTTECYSIARPRRQGINLSLLSTCKHTHKYATIILYRFNTFCFVLDDYHVYNNNNEVPKRGEALIAFINALSPLQSASLHRLHLRFDIVGDNKWPLDPHDYCVQSDWRLLAENSKQGEFEALAKLTGLRQLILDGAILPTDILQYSNYSYLPMTQALERVRSLNVRDLHVRLWLQTLNVYDGWSDRENRAMRSLEGKIRAVLLGLEDSAR